MCGAGGRLLPWTAAVAGCGSEPPPPEAVPEVVKEARVDAPEPLPETLVMVTEGRLRTSYACALPVGEEVLSVGLFADPSTDPACRLHGLKYLSERPSDEVPGRAGATVEPTPMPGVDDQVAHYQRHLATCGSSARPDERGRTRTTAWSLDIRQGRVVSVRRSDGERAEPGVETCVGGRLRRWRFPMEATGGLELSTWVAVPAEPWLWVAVGPVDAPSDVAAVLAHGAASDDLEPMRACYRTALERNPHIAGRFTVAAVVEAGVPQDAVVEGNTTGDLPMERCVLEAAVAWTFDPRVEGALRIPVVFHSR